MIKYWFSIIMAFSVASSAFAADYHYKVYKTDKQVIHVVKLNPKQYQAALLKAQNGRETVASMATRKKAQLAINAGFFDMGPSHDGEPTGSLVINGKAYKLKNKTQALAILHSGQLTINSANPKQYLKSHTGADYSLVSGIPMLISEGKIVEELAQKKGNFYVKPHARTALGLLANGDIVLCVVEHRYMKNLNAITIDEIQSFLKRKGMLLSEIYNKKQGDIKIEDFKKIFKGEFKAKEGIQGLSILELATFLKKLGCEFAINLDGGGSSTLWIEGTVVNSTIGDEDEAKGMSIVRPVSDAMLFSKRTL